MSNPRKPLAPWQMDWFEQRLTQAFLERVAIRERLVKERGYPVRRITRLPNSPQD
jgi:hypothetical protein